MGEYEDLCRQEGLDPSSEEDYERLQDSLVSGRRIWPSPGKDLGGAADEIHFSTFSEASEWSKRNGGRPFTRSSDGIHFIPVGSRDSTSPDRRTRFKHFSFLEHSVQFMDVSQAEVQAFLQGDAAPGSDWLPGTWYDFPISPELEAILERQSLLESKVFMPRLAMLAPDIHRNLQRTHPSYYASSVRAPGHHRKQTIEQLEQLLSLLEGKLTRTRRWYTTCAAARGESRTYEDIPLPSWSGNKLYEHIAKHGKTPKDLVYWHTLVHAVRAEITRRLSE